MEGRWKGLEIVMVNPHLRTEERAEKWTPEVAVVYHDERNKEGACDKECKKLETRKTL